MTISPTARASRWASSRNYMKTKLIAIALLLSSPLSAFEPERIVTCKYEDFAPVQRMLENGWSVKAQSSAYSYGGPLLHVFTLTSPSDAVKAELKAAADAARAAKAAEFQAKREAHLKAQAAVNVEAAK